MKTKFSLSSLADHHAVKLHTFYLLICTSPIDTIVYLLRNDNLHIGYMFRSKRTVIRLYTRILTKKVKVTEPYTYVLPVRSYLFCFTMYEMYMNAVLVAWLINVALLKFSYSKSSWTDIHIVLSNCKKKSEIYIFSTFGFYISIFS